MILWMAWSSLVSLLLGLMALAAERSMRATGRSARGVWGLAILGGIALQAWALLRTAEARAPILAASLTDGASGPIGMLAELQAAAFSLPAVLARYEPFALIAWACVAAVAVVVLLGGLARLELRATRWARARVAGEDVLISEDFGPALFGLRSPTIVLPEWALALSPEDLRLACLHEAEHRRAHDTWLLFAAVLVAALTPWNAALCWNVRRLRAAVEIDCDARVLSAGASPVAYGALLLELTSGMGDHRLPVAAFAKPPSLLERRLTMIVNDVRKGVPLGSLAGIAVCALLVVAACETPPPTGVQATDDASAAVLASESEAPSESAGTIKIRGQAATEAGAPLIYVDGVRLSGGLPDIEPESIERIEVIKGQRAMELYGDEAAAGVIQIFLKSGRIATDSEPKFRVDKLRFDDRDTPVDVSKVEQEGNADIARKKRPFGPG